MKAEVKLFKRCGSLKWHVAAYGETMSWGNKAYKVVSTEELQLMVKQGLIEDES